VNIPSTISSLCFQHFAFTLSASYVALGWFIDTNLGTEVIQHSGGIDGYSSFVGWNTHLK